MAAPIIKIGTHYLYRDKIVKFGGPVVVGTQWEVQVYTVDGHMNVASFDTEAKAQAAIDVLVNETEVDIIEDI